MKKRASKRDDAVRQVNEAMHALLLTLNLTRLGRWSDKLEAIHFLDLHVLSYAESHAEGTLGEMREAIQVPQSTLTSMIDRLEQRGLVRRAIHPQDKRSFRVELTAAGREVQREHHRVEGLIAARMLEALPDDESRRQFVALLSTMAKNLLSETES